MFLIFGLSKPFVLRSCKKACNHKYMFQSRIMPWAVEIHEFSMCVSLKKFAKNWERFLNKISNLSEVLLDLIMLNLWKLLHNTLPAQGEVSSSPNNFVFTLCRQRVLQRSLNLMLTFRVFRQRNSLYSKEQLFNFPTFLFLSQEMNLSGLAFFEIWNSRMLNIYQECGIFY